MRSHIRRMGEIIDELEKYNELKVERDALRKKQGSPWADHDYDPDPVLAKQILNLQDAMNDIRARKLY